MKKITSILLSGILCMGNIVLAEDNSIELLNVHKYNAAVGEAITYDFRQYSQNGTDDITDYDVSCDSENINVDENGKTISADVPGLYEITFSTDSGFNKTVKLAFNNDEAEIIKGNAVFEEDFEGDLPECFINTPNTTIKEDADSNRYMYVDARGNVFNSPLFGGNLTDFVFEADVQPLGCDASSTSQISVGMRAQENLAAYRFANHEVVKYPGSGHTAGTGNTVLKNAFSMSRSGSGVLLGTWYYAFVRDGFDDMYDSATRGHIKPYHWEVGIIGEDMTAKISDIESGESVAEFSALTSDMDNSSAPIQSGSVSLSFHSMAVRYDNIYIRPVVKADDIELDVDKDIITGNAGDDTVTYSVRISENGIEKQSEGMYTVECDGALVDTDEGQVTFTAPGEYYIVAKCGLKTAVSKVMVLPDYELIENIDITIPRVVYSDFELPVPDGVDIIYSSSNPEVITIADDKAVVTRPSGDSQDEEVILTAVIFKGAATIVKQYDITIKKQMSDSEAIENAVSDINIPLETTENITLPTSLPDGVVCKWETGDNTIISKTGKVTRSDVDKRVKLTAKISKADCVKIIEYYIIVKGTTGKSSTSVIAQTQKLCYEVGEQAVVSVRVFDNLGEITSFGDVNIETDSSLLTVDEENRTLSSDTEGVYTFVVRVPKYGFEKELSVAFNNKNIPAATDVKEVYSQDFESDDYDEAFRNDSRMSVSDGKLNMVGRSNNYQTLPFGPRDNDGNLIPLEEYIFEADMKMLACDAGSTGQMSVGVRYSEDDNSSYRMAHHERINYDANECAVNTSGATIATQTLSLAYGKSSAAASWYLPYTDKSPSSMFSGRGYSQEYHWCVTVTKNAMVAEIKDILTGETIQKISAPLEDLYIKKNGAKLSQLGAGTTVLGTWSTDLSVDNIKISTMSAFDLLELELDKEVSDSVNEEIGIKVYAVSGNERKLLDADDVVLSCNNPALTITDTAVIPTAEGEYIIKAEMAGKSTLTKLTVSGEEAELLNELKNLVPDVDMNAVNADFVLPCPAEAEVWWISSDESVLKIDSQTGIVLRPAVGETDKKVTLTVVVKKGDKVVTRSFVLNILANITDAQAIEQVKADLILPTQIKENIILPTECGDGVKVSWSSSDTKVITATGIVTPGAKDTAVVLTAVISRNGVKEKLKFNVTVKGKGSQNNGSQNPGGGGSSSSSGSGKKTPPMEVQLPVNVTYSVFSDLSGYEWAEEAILKLYQKGIVNGYENGCFMPQKAVTREEFVSMIVRTMGIEANAEKCFSDVDKDSWYAGYVAAAAHTGIVNGMSDGRFGIGETILRQDMAVITARAMGYEEGETEYFIDDNAVSEYARPWVYALKAAGIIVGDNGYFYPRNSLTRAEAAVVISRITE